MNEVIIVKPEKCLGCNACVRSCPAPEANRTIAIEENRFITAVDPDKCIACGACLSACQHGARDYIDDTEEAMATLAHEKMIILVSPAIKTVFPTKWKSILDWFRNKGCIIYDVSFGADICTWAHLRVIEHGENTNLISQQCSAIVNFIEIYQPKLLSNLSRIHSPVGCSVTYIKNYLRRTEQVAYLSPCIAKKREFDETGLVEYNITFSKLMEYFDRNDIRIPTDPDPSFKYRFDDQQGLMGGVFSRPGGLRDNLWMHNPDLHVTTSEGVHKVYPELEMYAKMPETKHPEIFDVLSCEYGCNIGPGTGSAESMFDVMTTMHEVERDAKSRRKTTGGVFRDTEDKQFKRFDEELRLADFIRSYKPSKPTSLPGESDLNPIFELMGMHSEDDRHYDCGACGHKTCKGMAVAIYRGLNTPNNCLIHAKSVLLSRHSELTQQHEKLSGVAQDCLELSERLSKALDEITENMKAIGENTNATSERAGVVSDLLKNVVAFCNSKSTMDSDSVRQLVGILETTIDAFGALDDHVSATNESSNVIKSSVGEIQKLVGSINETLKDAQKKK